MSPSDQQAIPDIHQFDINDAAYTERIFDVFAAMQRHGTVTRVETFGGYWMITGYEELSRAFRDWRTFTSTQGVMWPDLTKEGHPLPEGRRQEGPMPPIDLDPPLHRVYRKFLNPFFSAVAVDAIESNVRAEVDILIDAFIETGRADLWHQLADPLPTLVFFNDLVHLPDALAKGFYETFTGMDELFALGPKEHDQEQQQWFAHIRDICADLVEARRHQPPLGDLVDAVLSAEVEGRRLDSDEAIGLLHLLCLGGTETTSITLTAGLHYLAGHEDLRQTLIDDPNLIPNAVEEFLRLMGAVQFAGRTVLDHVELGGQKLCPGDKVMLPVAAANRDPREFPDPDAFDLNRYPNRHAAFGLGAHRCIGSHLARLELRVGFERVLARLPDYRLPEGYVFRRRSVVPKDLMVHFTPGRRVGP